MANKEQQIELGLDNEQDRLMAHEEQQIELGLDEKHIIHCLKIAKSGGGRLALVIDKLEDVEMNLANGLIDEGIEHMANAIVISRHQDELLEVLQKNAYYFDKIKAQLLDQIKKQLPEAEERMKKCFNENYKVIVPIEQDRAINYKFTIDVIRMTKAAKGRLARVFAELEEGDWLVDHVNCADAEKNLAKGAEHLANGVVLSGHRDELHSILISHCPDVLGGSEKRKKLLEDAAERMGELRQSKEWMKGAPSPRK